MKKDADQSSKIDVKEEIKKLQQGTYDNILVNSEPKKKEAGEQPPIATVQEQMKVLSKDFGFKPAEKPTAPPAQPTVNMAEKKSKTVETKEQAAPAEGAKVEKTENGKTVTVVPTSGKSAFNVNVQSTSPVNVSLIPSDAGKKPDRVTEVIQNYALSQKKEQDDLLAENTKVFEAVSESFINRQLIKQANTAEPQGLFAQMEKKIRDEN